MFRLLDRTRKFLSTLYACSMIGKRWGLFPNIVKWIYAAIVRPIHFYGAIVRRNAQAISVRRLQRQATIAIAGALLTTHSDALDLLHHFPPVDLLAQELATNCAVRHRANSLFKCHYEGHSTILDRVV